MSLEQVLALVSALTFAILTPGPSIIATVQTAMSQGRQAALPYALGLAVGASLWCILALAGLAVLFRTHPTAYTAVRLFGACYLMWFAWGLWQSSSKPLPQAAPGSRQFWGGIALNLSNPKPALFYAFLILSLFPGPLSLQQQIGLYAICLATELFWYSCVAIAMSTTMARNRYFSAKLWIDRAASIAMAVLAFLLVFQH